MVPLFRYGFGVVYRDRFRFKVTCLALSSESVLLRLNQPIAELRRRARGDIEVQERDGRKGGHRMRVLKHHPSIQANLEPVGRQGPKIIQNLY